MGNVHTLSLTNLYPVFIHKLTAINFRNNAATGTATNPQKINDYFVTALCIFDDVGEYCEIEFDEPCYISQFRHYGTAMQSEDGTYKIQHWDGAGWVDNTTSIATRQGSWSAFADLTLAVVTKKIRIIATALDTYNDHNDTNEWEIIG